MSENIHSHIEPGNTHQEENAAAIYKKYPVRRGLTGLSLYYIARIVTAIFIKLRAEGTENIPLQAPYVISPNHETYVDGMFVAAHLPKGHFKLFCSMAAKELEDSHGWLGKAIIRVGRGIAADRFGNPVRALILAKKQLDKKQILLLHPEGTRSSDGQFGEFKDGAAYLAIKAHCPLVPVYIHGGYSIYNRHMKWPRPFEAPFRRKTVTVMFGKPLLPSDFPSKTEMTAALLDSVTKLKENIVSRTKL